jgi:anti-sigma B factor antagonist
MNLTITTNMLGDIAVCTLAGRLTLSNTSELRNCAKGLIAAGTVKLILDLSALIYVDSSGLADLISIYTTARNRGGNLVLLQPTGKVRDLFMITKTYTIFPIHASIEEALTFLTNNTSGDKR